MPGDPPRRAVSVGGDMRVLIYIDPGKSGGIAWRDAAGDVHVDDLPKRTIELQGKRKDSSPKTREVTDAVALSWMFVRMDWYDDDHPEPPLVAWERWANSGKSSTTSAILQGRNAGIVEGVVAGVMPDAIAEEHYSKEVRSTCGVPSGGTYEERKAAAVERACELWPSFVDKIKVHPAGRQRTVQVKDGRADALLGLKFMIDREEREG